MAKTQAEYDQILRDKYIINGECWDFTGCLDNYGYGIIQQFGKANKAHRKMYEMAHGPIPDGHDVHHTCHRRICGNPNHLISQEREVHGRSHARYPTHCPKDHPYDEENTGIRSNGHRRCRTCGREYHHKKKAP
jgi:hypothetical protein